MCVPFAWSIQYTIHLFILDFSSQENPMKILKSCLICIPFFLILGGGFILGFMQPDEPISLVENRELMQRPKLDFQHISQFATDYTTYVVEQFPFREEFLKEYTKMCIRDR